MTIWKYPLPVREDVYNLQMPKGAKILSCGVQNGRCHLWVLVDPEAPKVNRVIHRYGTGWDQVPEDGTNFIGTCITEIGMFVWHFFDRGEK
jgi:hypothetical protein